MRGGRCAVWLGCEGWLTWEQIHRARPRVPLTCPECGWALCPKPSPNRLRYFAHDPGAPECSLREETEQHRQLKRDLADCCRQVPGWMAELEQAGPERAWRADVLATHTTGNRYVPVSEPRWLLNAPDGIRVLPRAAGCVDT